MNLFQTYRPVMESMEVLDKNHLEDLKLSKEEKNGLSIYYSAHTDYMDSHAKIVFIGICPGFEQMKLSFDIVKNDKGKEEEKVLKEAKTHARFGLSMRKNLIALSDQTVLPQALHIKSCAELFDKDNHLMDNTCLLPYPVFKDGKNYTGHSPKIDKSPLLNSICQKQLEKIAKTYPDALFIPLGKCVDEQVSKMKIIDDDRIVHGFPHPSGANGHRFKQMEANKERINKKILDFFNSTKE